MRLQALLSTLAFTCLAVGGCASDDDSEMSSDTSKFSFFGDGDAIVRSGHFEGRLKLAEGKAPEGYATIELDLHREGWRTDFYVQVDAREQAFDIGYVAILCTPAGKLVSAERLHQSLDRVNAARDISLQAGTLFASGEAARILYDRLLDPSMPENAWLWRGFTGDRTQAPTTIVCSDAFRRSNPSEWSKLKAGKVGSFLVEKDGTPEEGLSVTFRWGEETGMKPLTR